MPTLLTRALVGTAILIKLTVPTIGNRILILFIGLAIGFLGPALALDGPFPWHEGTWIWDQFAAACLKNGRYPDLILAILPLVFIGFTDFMNHVLDEEYRFDDGSLLYFGIFALLAALMLAACVLPAQYADLAAPDSGSHQPRWFADFAISWLLVKSVVTIAFLFEGLLGTVEALRAFRRRRDRLAEAEASKRRRRTRAKTP